ncbi:hypothetical protein JCM5353_001261, partial [Sporobolomyces roseus]
TAMRESEHHQTRRVYFAGRSPTSSIATGSKKQHNIEIENYLEQAFDLSKHSQDHQEQKAHANRDL